jgi:hypothetical protein
MAERYVSMNWPPRGLLEGKAVRIELFISLFATLTITQDGTANVRSHESDEDSLMRQRDVEIACPNEVHFHVAPPLRHNHRRVHESNT